MGRFVAEAPEATLVVQRRVGIEINLCAAGTIADR